MTRVRIPQPDTEEDVSAEQVTDWLLARDWLDVSSPGSTWRTFGLRGAMLHMLPEDRTMDPGAHLAEVIERIANVVRRHPSAVLADIVGPARAASVGAYCEPWLFVAELRVRLSCKLPACDRMGCSAAHGAGESEE